MRGRLINKMYAMIARLDTDTTAKVELDNGRTGYDDVFREVEKKSDPDGGAVGESVRAEMELISIPCQVEPLTWRETQVTPGGDNPASAIKLITHMRYLESDGLIRDDGLPSLRKGDRLDRIMNKHNKTVQQFDGHPTGMYLYSITPSSHGLNMADPKVNLVILIFTNRQQGISA